MKKQLKAFTLVELIVVIVILAILGTIAFISFQGYSRNSRDGVRIADINSAKKSLEIFITKAGFYPTPDNGVNITYSGATVWTEGTLGTNVIKNIQSVSKVITDPLTANEYTYSITISKTEYQIGAISEGGGLTENIPTNNTYAADLSKSSAVAYISGNYNEKFTKVNTGTTSWILAQPSIISTDKTTSTDLANILSNKKLSYNNYSNIPSSYNTPGTQSGGFNYTNGNPIIFTGTLEELHEDNQRKLDFLTNLKQAYTSTDLATNPMYEDIMSQDTATDSTGAINLVISYINSNKGGIKLEELALLPTSGTGTTGGGTNTYACIGTLVTANADITNTEGLTSNTNYQTTNSSNSCYYTCKTNYSGTNCETYTAPITQWKDIPGTNCTNDDYVFTLEGTTYRWAGCNSILGTTGISTNENVYNGLCRNYTSSTTMTNCSSTYLTYTAKENVYNSTYGEDNIWGKFYLWDNAVQANNACPTGWHLPTDDEFEKIETYLNGGINCRNATDSWLCNGLGFSGKLLKTTSNNIVKALRLPLAGVRSNGAFYGLGEYTILRSSNEYNSSAYGRLLNQNYSGIYRGYRGKSIYGVGVRCIKD